MGLFNRKPVLTPERAREAWDRMTEEQAYDLGREFESTFGGSLKRWTGAEEARLQFISVLVQNEDSAKHRAFERGREERKAELPTFAELLAQKKGRR
jgi:hypothetical protein